MSHDLRYYRYNADGTSAGGSIYYTLERVAEQRLANPTISYELVRRPDLPKPYVTKTYRIESEYPDGTECLRSTQKVVWGFYPHEGNDPTQHSVYRKKEADYTIDSVTALADNRSYFPGTMVSTDNGLWECIANTNSGISGTNDSARPPTADRIATTFWTPMAHWDGEKVLLLRGKTQANIATDMIAVDPSDFMCSMVVSYTNGRRYGFGLYAGANKPTTLFGATTGVTEGFLVFVGTTQAGATLIYVFGADGTTTPITGSNEWIASNGATAIGNKRLSVPRICNVDDTTDNKINIQILHRDGRIVVYFDGVNYGEYIYDPELYPFRFQPDPANATDYIPVTQHQINTGLIGFGDDDGSTASSVFIHSLEVGKVNPEQLRAIL